MVMARGTQAPGTTSDGNEQPRFHAGELVQGRYELSRVLGIGGIGEVWAAEDIRLQRMVALKTLRVDDPDLVERFVREARETAALTHPAIVRVFDFGLSEDRTPYLVMELLEGVSLSEVLRSGPISEEEVVMIGVRLADALAYAHGRGLVHRDVKPENVVFCFDGGRLHAKLIDFGLVKNVRQDHARALTRAGTFVGTPEYASPEQARGLALSGKTDVWSLAVILYHALAGRPPFRGVTPMHCLRSVLSDPISPLGCSAELWGILTRALDRDVARRPEADELADQLHAWLATRGLQSDAVGAFPIDFLPELARSEAREPGSTRPPRTSVIRSIPPARLAKEPSRSLGIPPPAKLPTPEPRPVDVHALASFAPPAPAAPPTAHAPPTRVDRTPRLLREAAGGHPASVARLLALCGLVSMLVFGVLAVVVYRALS